MRIRVRGSSVIYIRICLYGPNMGYMLIWAKIAEVGYYLCGFFLPAGIRVWVVYIGMKTDRIRTDITHIIFVFIFLFGFGFGHG